MSHIPASAMPHAKPHDEDHPKPHDDQQAQPATTPGKAAVATGAPQRYELATGVPLGSAPGVPPKGPGKRPGPGSATPFVAIAAVATVAVGGIVAALALRKEAHPDGSKAAKGKRKGGSRKNKHA